jgi:hypothetical protein
MRRNNIASLWAVLALAAAGAAAAKAPAEDVARLGQSLTPVGAEQAASADGKIPAWTGGASVGDFGSAFQNFKEGDAYPDVFAGDKPLFKITHDNYTQYAAQLPAGAVEMLKRYPEYFLNIYPTRRTASFPAAIYQATKANAATAHLEGNDDLRDAHLGFPFPIPQSGAEVIWNHKVRYLGDTVDETANLLVVSPGGDFHTADYTQSVQFFYANPKMAEDKKQGLIFQLERTQTGPPRVAGQVSLAWERMNGTRDAWAYLPGTHRVLTAPMLAFDSPMAGADGGVSTDQSDMFNGSLKMYSWKLLGKREMYIGYNNFHLQEPSLKYKDIIRTHHLNPEHLRYELHRVWVVEATLQPGLANVLARRVFYVDEDSWTIAAVDCYDNHNQLWRYQEGHLVPLLVDKVVVPAPEVVYDFNSGRYVAINLTNELRYVAKFGVALPADYFTPQYLQNTGRQ